MSTYLIIIGAIGFIVCCCLVIIAEVRERKLKPYIIGTAIFAIVVMVGLASQGLKNGSDDDTSATNTSTSQNATSTPTIVQTPNPLKQDMTISIVSSKIGKDYKDAPILLVEYEFTNNTDKAKSFTFLCIDKAFQGGVECDSIVVSNEVDAQQQLNDIQPGASYKLTVGYNLHDTTQDVEIEITELLGNDVFLKQTIKLAE